MLKRYILLTILLVSTLFISSDKIQANFVNTTNPLVELKENKINTYTERVLINDVWWIIIYADDGSIINMYEDPIQD